MFYCAARKFNRSNNCSLKFTKCNLTHNDIHCCKQQFPAIKNIEKCDFPISFHLSLNRKTLGFFFLKKFQFQTGKRVFKSPLLHCSISCTIVNSYLCASKIPTRVVQHWEKRKIDLCIWWWVQKSIEKSVTKTREGGVWKSGKKGEQD